MVEANLTNIPMRKKWCLRLCCLHHAAQPLHVDTPQMHPLFFFQKYFTSSPLHFFFPYGSNSPTVFYFHFGMLLDSYGRCSPRLVDRAHTARTAPQKSRFCATVSLFVLFPSPLGKRVHVFSYLTSFFSGHEPCLIPHLLFSSGTLPLDLQRYIVLVFAHIFVLDGGRLNAGFATFQFPSLKDCCRLRKQCN